MKNITKITFLVFFVLYSNISFPDTRFNFRYDYSLFKGVEGKSIVEFYYSFYKKGLIFNFTDGNYNAQAKIDMDIFKKGSNELVFSQTYLIPTSVSDTSGNNLDNNLVGQLNYQIEPGEYTVKIYASDANNSLNIDSASTDLIAENFATGLKISEIELSSDIITNGDDKSIFYKNTLEVIPNPNSIYGNNMDKLYYYFELYGINTANISDEFYILTEIKDPNKENIFLKSVKKFPSITSEDIVQHGNFTIDSLPTSKYILSISIVDNKNTVKTSREKSFWIYNSNITQDFNVSEDEEFLRSPYASMREDLIDKEYEITTYIRTDRESNIYSKLTSLGEKRKFMYDFWKNRDESPSTPQNEFKIDFVTRVLEADATFKEPYREGWKTDRGRIYVLYGKPDDIERFSFEANKKSHEIWTYEKLEGGATCVFVERNPEGSGYFDLVHSTIRSEIRNDNWESELNY
jgi:GWxTD domain-containing protein